MSLLPIANAAGRRSNRSKQRRLFFESLEDRRLLATFTVNSTDLTPDSYFPDNICDTANDPTTDPPTPPSNICTLPAAIAQANATPGPDTIQFNIPGDGVPTIDLARDLLVAGPIILDGTSQPGGAKVEITSPANVLTLLSGSDGSTIRGLVINDSAGGIGISSNNNFVVGNFFGTDPTGSTSVPNSGTAIALTGNNNTVGGTTESDRNVISGGEAGVVVLASPGINLFASGNKIQGNYIGTDVTGTSSIPNTSFGVDIIFARDTMVMDNVIAANGTGVVVQGNTASGNIIQSNFVGTDVTGTITDPNGVPSSGDELGNGKGIFVNDAPGVMIENNVIVGSTGIGADFGYGVHIANSRASGALIKGNYIGVGLNGDTALGNQAAGVIVEAASDLVIGGSTPADRNVISGNGGDGITIFGTANSEATNNQILGNLIGLAADGETDLGNAFRGVQIGQLANNNIIGGDSSAARNIISGNDADGVIIATVTSTENVIKGNHIGTNESGTATVPNAENGVWIFNAPYNIVGQAVDTTFSRNLISGNGLDGIRIEGIDAAMNIVEGNLVGTSADGASDLGNSEAGVYILGAPENRIGAQLTPVPTNPLFRGNVISGNKVGVKIEHPDATNNQVEGNLIGLDSTGKAPLGNDEAGVHIINADENRIGSQMSRPAPAAAFVGNTISANQRGVVIENAASHGNQIAGNRIGTDAEGNLVGEEINIFLNLREGILIVDAHENYIGGDPDFFIGDTPPNGTSLPGNVIAGNGADGIQIEGEFATENQIRRNMIYSNANLGIELVPHGVTPNDELDTDAGPNNLQNFPILDSIDPDSAIRGTLHSTPETQFTIDIFASDEPDPSGQGEGQVFLGQTTVTTDKEGNGTFSLKLTTTILTPPSLTATATDPKGNTSEFSAPLELPDLEVDAFAFFVSDVERRGNRYFLPYEVTVRNRGFLRAENAEVFIRGNGELLTPAAHRISLDPGEAIDPPLTGEWDITDEILAGTRGIAALDFVVDIDPDNLIEELPFGVNRRELELSFDARPRIEAVRSEYHPEPKGYYLAGVSLPNKIELDIDWNGDLVDSNTGIDEQQQLYFEINGVNQTVISVTDAADMATFTIDLGSDLQQGANTVRMRAETRLLGFASPFEVLNYHQGNSVESLGLVWQPFPVPPTGFNKVVEYKTGFHFPPAYQHPDSPETAGFYNLPLSRVGFAAGAFGGKFELGGVEVGASAEGNVQASVRSDRTGQVSGFLKLNGKVAAKDSFGADGSIIISPKGDFIFEDDGIHLKTFQGTLRGQVNVTTPKVLLPFAPIISAQGKFGGGIEGTLRWRESDQGDWVYENATVALNALGEGILSAGNAKVVSLEVAGGVAGRVTFQFPSEPCLTQSVNVLAYYRWKAQFLSLFEVQQVYRHLLASNTCPAPFSEGESGDSQIITTTGLVPRFFDGNPEGEPSDEGLPNIAFPYAMPTLSRHTDGTMTLVWIDEDPTKPDGQHLEVFASRYDGSSWSSPVQITHDTLIDNQPTVAYDSDGRAIAMWTRVKNTLTDVQNADPKSLLDELEIVYAVYDPNGDTWSPSMALTDNAAMDFLPRLETDSAGNVMAMWLREDDNDSPIFPDDTTALGADYVFSIWDGTGWSEPTIAVTAANSNEAPEFARGKNESLFVWSDDADGNITTNVDREIHLATWDGTTWSSSLTIGAADGIADVSPRIAYGSQDQANIIWVREGVSIGPEETDITDELYFAEWDTGVLSTPELAFAAPGIVDPHLLVDGDGNLIAIWQSQSESGPDIFYAMRDRSGGQWSEPMQFTESDSHEWWFNPFINAEDELEIIFLGREVGSEPAPPDPSAGAEGEDEAIEMIPTFTTSGLASVAAPLGRDLTVEVISLDDVNPELGTVAQVAVTVANSGQLSTPEVSLVLLDDGVPVGLAQTVPALAAGESFAITFDWSVPATVAAPHLLTAQVDSDGQLVESDESNNEDTVTVLLPDLVVDVVLTDATEGDITVTADIVNQGVSPIEVPFEVALRQDDADTGTSLASQTITDPLAPGERTTISFLVADALATLGGAATGFVVVDSASSISESDETNNSNFGALDALLFIRSELANGTSPFTIRRDVDDVVITQQDATELLRRSIAELNELTLDGSIEADAAIVDASSGEPIPGRGLRFDAGAGDDSLSLLGRGSERILYLGGDGTDSVILASSGFHLDLTDPLQHGFLDIEVIDIIGNSPNELTITPTNVHAITDDNNTLLVRHDDDDSVHYASAWEIVAPIFIDGEGLHVVRSGGAELRIANSKPWQNPLWHLDSNLDNEVSPLDVLVVINTLIDRGSRPLSVPANPEGLPTFYYDTSGDNAVSPLDALLAINFLNAVLTQPEGEVESRELDATSQLGTRAAPTTRIAKPRAHTTLEAKQSNDDPKSHASYFARFEAPSSTKDADLRRQSRKRTNEHADLVTALDKLWGQGGLDEELLGEFEIQ